MAARGEKACAGTSMPNKARGSMLLTNPILTICKRAPWDHMHETQGVSCGRFSWSIIAGIPVACAAGSEGRVHAEPLRVPALMSHPKMIHIHGCPTRLTQHRVLPQAETKSTTTEAQDSYLRRALCAPQFRSGNRLGYSHTHIFLQTHPSSPSSSHLPRRQLPRSGQDTALPVDSTRAEMRGRSCTMKAFLIFCVK
jgi:hypothetical protein